MEKKLRIIDLNELEQRIKSFNIKLMTPISENEKKEIRQRLSELTMVYQRYSSPESTRDALLKDFENNTDCYADTWIDDSGTLMEGAVIPAMTKEGFKILISNLIK